MLVFITQSTLGPTVAFIMEIELDTPESLAISILFICVGGAFFTWTRSLAYRVPQEAVIGIVYIVANINRLSHK